MTHNNKIYFSLLFLSVVGSWELCLMVLLSRLRLMEQSHLRPCWSSLSLTQQWKAPSWKCHLIPIIPRWLDLVTQSTQQVGQHVYSATCPGGWMREIFGEPHYKLSLSVLQVTRYSTHSTSHRQNILPLKKSIRKSHCDKPQGWRMLSGYNGVDSTSNLALDACELKSYFPMLSKNTVVEQKQRKCTKHSPLERGRITDTWQTLIWSTTILKAH